MRVNEVNAQRTRLGLTHEELAEKVGVKRHTLRNWIYGTVKIPDEYIPKMAIALGFDLETTKYVFADEIDDIFRRYDAIVSPFSGK